MEEWMKSSLLMKINSKYTSLDMNIPQAPLDYTEDRDVVTLSHFLYTIKKLGMYKKRVVMEELSPPVWIVMTNILLARHNY